MWVGRLVWYYGSHWCVDRLLKQRLHGPTPIISDSGGLGWGLMTCIPSQFSGGANVAGPGTILQDVWSRLIFQESPWMSEVSASRVFHCKIWMWFLGHCWVQGWASSVKSQVVNIGLYGFCRRYSTALLSGDVDRDINKWAWHCSNKTLFTQTGASQIWPTQFATQWSSLCVTYKKSVPIIYISLLGLP